MNDSRDALENDEPPIGPDTLLQLTPGGRLLWDQLVDACSVYAGRPVDRDELLGILRAFREERGGEDADFCDPAVVEAFCRRLRVTES